MQKIRFISMELLSVQLHALILYKIPIGKKYIHRKLISIHITCLIKTDQSLSLEFIQLVQILGMENYLVQSGLRNPTSC
jgi:hypothetical protein